MLKYEKYMVTFTEVPDEIALCFNLTNCPCHCEKCFEPWLRDDFGTVLTFEDIEKIWTTEFYNSPTCICFLGGDNDHKEVARLSKLIHEKLHLKTAMYSGFQKFDEVLAADLDYYKIGPYDETKGPLNKKTTNQIFFKKEDAAWIDITYKFQKGKI